ncbi:MAG: serine hydrolase [Cyanobacteria bacterium P01_D01_bin.6]
MESRLFKSPTSIQAMLEAIVGNGRVVGVVVGLLDADGSRQVIAHGSAGSNALPLNGESVFEIGSITKVFTGILLADMVRRGEVELSEPIAQLLPPQVYVPIRHEKPITLLHITTHHSGLPRLPTNLVSKDPDNPYADYTVQQMYEFLAGYELPRDPGETFEYSNYAMGLLGHALALRAGMNYEALLTERVLQPLGLLHTAITLTPRMESHLAYGHNGFGDRVPLWDMPTLAGAGALRSTVNDLLDFAASNLSPDQTNLGPVLKDAQRLRRQLGERSDSIGCNWLISKPGEHTVTWHNGGTGGYRTFLGLDLEANRAAVVLANSGGDTVDDVGFHLLDPTVPLQPPSIATVIASTYRTKGIEGAINHYQSLCNTNHDRFQIDEHALNNVGYWLLRQGLIEDAIAIFRLNVETYPDVPDSHDSLGDACMAASRLTEAKESYERAVKLAAAAEPLRLSLYQANLEKVTKQLSQQ